MSGSKPEWNPKQQAALDYLKDNVTEEIFYGGAAGGGKTWLGCAWIINMCRKYKGSSWFIGRENLNDLRIHNLQSMHEVFHKHRRKMTDVLTFNAQDNIFRWKNGRTIKYLALKYQPSDPLYERFGSTQFTGGWIEEAAPVEALAYDVLKSRIGRWRNDHFGLTKKLLVTCNPTKNWLYGIHKKYMNHELPPHQVFIPAFVEDNIFWQRGYKSSLERINDQSTKERLLYGNWEFSDDPSQLIEQEALNYLFCNTNVLPLTNSRQQNNYITADIARYGKDTTVILLWEGFMVERIIIMKNKNTLEVTREINDMMREYNIPPMRVIVDEDGVGGGVKDNLHCQGFINNARALNNDNYENLKSQCYFKLAKKINEGELYIKTSIPDLQQKIREELEQVRQKNMDNDTQKLGVIAKDEIKKRLQRSPDIADALMMRLYFELTVHRPQRAKVYY